MKEFTDEEVARKQIQFLARQEGKLSRLASQILIHLKTKPGKPVRLYTRWPNKAEFILGMVRQMDHNIDMTMVEIHVPTALQRAVLPPDKKWWGLSESALKAVRDGTEDLG